jgi:excisionase family DNA binding protein
MGNTTDRQSDKKFDLLSIPQAAQVMGLSRIEVYRKVKRGEIPAQRLGRNYFVLRKDLGQIYSPLTKASQRKVDQAVRKTLKEYGETLKLLGKE